MDRAERITISQRSLCLTEIAQETDACLEPISGYENMPLVSIEKAVEPLIDFLPNIHSYITKAREHYRDPGDGLTKDESISIMLYTMSWEPCEECLYFALNTVLRSPNRRKLKPWFLYLRLFLNGLFRLPPMSCNIYRGIKSHSNRKHPGETVVWWGFSSCTRTLNVLQSKQFLGKEGERTIFIIECHSGRDISKHSYFPFEEEVLLLAATQLKVTGCLNQNDLRMIEMKEIRSSEPLLRPVSVVITLDEICSSGSKMFAPNFIPPTPRAMSVASGIITPKGKSNSSVVQSVASFCPYQNSVLEENIAENRYSPELILKSMGLTDQDMKIVAVDAIRTTTTLIILNLDNNKIGPQGVYYLSEQLKHNKTITTLSLQYNQIGDKGTQHLSNLLRQTTKITKLDLFKNQITEKGAHYLGNALLENQTLRTLNLSSNRFGALGTEHLCHALKQNTRLTTLILSFNDVGDQGSQYLRDALRENTTLTTLELEHSQIKAQGIHYLNDALQQNTTLLRLNLLHNPFGERGIQFLHDLKRKNKKLKILF